MARVLLAKARFTCNYGDGALVPPLGAMYIASVLRAEGHDVRIFDLGEDGEDLSRFRAAIEAHRPDLLGLSAITIEARIMEAMASAARALRPRMPIFVGGPHATAYPERCARLPSIDYVVVGEGERTAIELVDALTRHPRDPREIPGLVFADAAGEIVETPERDTIKDVDGIPFPSWDLIDINVYANSTPMSGTGQRRYMLLFTSRGCPFKCIYCHEVQGKRFRARSPENVLAEMRVLRERYGINDFEIIDDIFNFDRERMLDILERVQAFPDKPALHFPNALRTDILDEKQIIALRRAGTTSLSIAVETTSLRLQKLVKKHLKVERVRENMEIAVRHGMFTRGFFMLGFPTETWEEAKATVDFAVASPLHQAFFFIVTPFAGTALYELYQDLLRKKGIDVEHQEVAYMTGNYNLSDMSDRELFGLQRSAFRRFYVNPRRMIRIVARHPRPQDLFRVAGSFARILSVSRTRTAPKPLPVTPAAAPAPTAAPLNVLPLRIPLSLREAPARSDGTVPALPVSAGP